MPVKNFTTLWIGDFVSRTVTRKGNVLYRTKHKVIRFSEEFFVIDNDEKIKYNGKKLPGSADSSAEGIITYDFWRENDREFSQNEIFPVAFELVGSALISLKEKFPECTDEFLKEKIIQLLR